MHKKHATKQGKYLCWCLLEWRRCSGLKVVTVITWRNEWRRRRMKPPEKKEVTLPPASSSISCLNLRPLSSWLNIYCDSGLLPWNILSNYWQARDQQMLVRPSSPSYADFRLLKFFEPPFIGKESVFLLTSKFRLVCLTLWPFLSLQNHKSTNISVHLPAV